MNVAGRSRSPRDEVGPNEGELPGDTMDADQAG